MRTIPEIHTEEEDRQLHETHAFHENGRVFNMCPDYGMLMADGFTKKAEKIRTQLEKAETAEQKEFLQAMLDVLSIVTDFAARYREEALRVGNQTVADTLSKIPANAPETLLEALQFLRLLHYAMWCNGNYHNTIGRIDQFLYPYYRHDLDAGLLTKDGALELLEEFSSPATATATSISASSRATTGRPSYWAARTRTAPTRITICPNCA